jgi:predicted CopG family antitoxin
MSHQVRLSDEVYERIKSQKRDDETFSEAVDRLTADWTLDDYAEEEPVMDPEKHRELLEEVEEDSTKSTSERLKRQGIDVDE